MKKSVKQMVKDNVKSIFVALVVVSSLGCGDSDKDVGVQNISLNKTSVTLDPGQTEQIIATVEPSDATNKRVLWTSQNEAIATVSSDGTVEAKTPGETKVIVTSVGNETIKAEATVTVNNVDLSLAVAGTYHGQVTMDNQVANPDVTMILTRTGINALSLHAEATIMMVPLVIDCTLAVANNNGSYTITGDGLTNDYGWGPKDVVVAGTISTNGNATISLDVDSITETVVFTGTK
jgi:uncharacterized protein YjdB